MQSLLNKNYVFGPLAISIFTLLISLLAQKFLPPQIPLFYGLPIGAEQLSSSFSLIIPGALSFVISLSNLLLWLKIKDDFLKKVLMTASYVIALFMAITTVKIIFLVGSF
jgi:hypothetical protein